MAARLASVLVGILCLEASVFGQIIPVALAGVLAGWDAVAPGRSPASWLVRRLGNPPAAFVPAAELRVGQGVLAALCLGAVIAAAGALTVLAWAIAAAVGGLGILACIVGRPALGAWSRSGGPMR